MRWKIKAARLANEGFPAQLLPAAAFQRHGHQLLRVIQIDLSKIMVHLAITSFYCMLDLVTFL